MQVKTRYFVETHKCKQLNLPNTLAFCVLNGSSSTYL